MVCHHSPSQDTLGCRPSPSQDTLVCHPSPCQDNTVCHAIPFQENQVCHFDNASRVFRSVLISQYFSAGYRKRKYTDKQRHLEGQGTVDVGQVLSVSTAHAPDDRLGGKTRVRVRSSEHLVHDRPGTYGDRRHN